MRTYNNVEPSAITNFLFIYDENTDKSNSHCEFMIVKSSKAPVLHCLHVILNVNM